jgi:hypothetical protein
VVLAAINGRLNWKVMREVGIETTLTTCFIFAIFVGATVFAYVLRLIGGDELIAEFFKGLGLGPVQLVLVVLAVVFVAGFFLDWFEIVLIILPLLAPVIKLAGVDMTWFLILIALMLQTSFLTPPVGFSLFYLKGVVPKGVTIKDIYVGVIPSCCCNWRWWRFACCSRSSFCGCRSRCMARAADPSPILTLSTDGQRLHSFRIGGAHAGALARPQGHGALGRGDETWRRSSV